MGRVGKGVKCSVTGCERQAIRSLPTEKVITAGLKIDKVRRGYLCRDHYKEFKKGIKKEKRIEKWMYKG